MPFMTGSLFVLALFSLQCATRAGALLNADPEPYHIKPPPLTTQWTYLKDSTPHTWPQHPRPLLYRPSWQTLNGIWTYQPANASAFPPPDGPLAKEVLVPSCLEGGLSGIMEAEATYSWYTTSFTIPRSWSEDNKRVLMHFEAVDYQATVYVNGQMVTAHQGGYSRFSIDVTEQLGGLVNQVHVHVFDPTDLDLEGNNIPTGKQSRNPSHIFYTPCSGIWQTVWLESVPRVHIKQLDVTADMHGKMTIDVQTSTVQEADFTFALYGTSGELAVIAIGPSGTKLTVDFDDALPWTPELPTLYNFTITMGNDTVQSYTAFRSISTGVVDGIKRPLLNGEFVFWFGTLDQGYWPDGIYLPPTLDAMQWDLRLLKSLGMNMIRKHIKVELDLFYRLCDEMGIMVIQDMPSLFPETPRRPPTPDQQAEFERQLETMIIEHRNYPSIVAWVIYNEGWGQKMEPPWPEEKLVKRVKELDPTRLVDATTGWNDHGFGDFSDNHHYSSPQCGTPFSSLGSIPFNPGRIGFQGEFGGTGHIPPDENLWPVQKAKDTINQTYEIATDLEAYNYRTHQVLTELRDQIEKYSCSGAVYTQTTDVEGEVNGLVTYDRRLERIDREQWTRDVRALYWAAAAARAPEVSILAEVAA